MIDMDGGLFDDGRRDSLAGQHRCERAPADAAADNDDFRIAEIVHDRIVAQAVWAVNRTGRRRGPEMKFDGSHSAGPAG